MDQLAAAVLLPGFHGTTAPDWLLRRVADGLGGVVLFGRNVVDDAQVTSLCGELRSVRPDVVIGIDEEGGDVTRLDAGRGSEVPGNHALGAADDLDLTRSVAVEALGPETVLVAEIAGGKEIAARLGRSFGARVNETQRLHVDPRQLQLFDPETTLAVPRPQL